MVLKELFGEHHPEALAPDHRDFLREVTIGLGRFARRGFILTEESKPATFFHERPVGHKQRVVLEQQPSGGYAMIAVHISQIFDKLMGDK